MEFLRKCVYPILATRGPRIAARALCISAFLIFSCGMVWKWGQPGVVMGDLVQHHVAGQVVRDQGVSAIYTGSTVGLAVLKTHHIEKDLTNLNFNYLFPPLVGIVCSALADWPYAYFTTFWFLVSLAFFFCALRFSRLLFPSLPKADWLLATLGLPVVFYVFMPGQNSHLILCILFASAWLLTKDRPLLAGFIVSCAFFKPNWLFLIAWFMFCAGHWRWIAGLALGGICWGALSLLAAGWEAHRQWLQVLAEMSQGRQFMPNYLDQSLGGALRRSLPFLPSWVSMGAMLGILGILARLRRRFQPWEQLLFGLAALPTFSPYTMFYDTVFGLGVWYLLLERSSASPIGKAALVVYWMGTTLGANPSEWVVSPAVPLLLVWQLLLLACPFLPRPSTRTPINSRANG